MPSTRAMSGDKKTVVEGCNAAGKDIIDTSILFNTSIFILVLIDISIFIFMSQLREMWTELNILNKKNIIQSINNCHQLIDKNMNKIQYQTERLNNYFSKIEVIQKKMYNCLKIV